MIMDLSGAKHVIDVNKKEKFRGLSQKQFTVIYYCTFV